MGSGDNIYDRSKAPKEGISSISARTRQRLYGQPQPQNFSDWYAQQQRGPAQGPVKTDQTAPQQNDFYTGNAPTLTLDNQQQLLSNMFKPVSEAPAGGQGSDRQLQMYLDFKREQMANDINQNPAKLLQAYQAQAQAQDPVRFAEQQQEAERVNPWAKGGQFYGHTAQDIYTPEEIMASQGNTAQNQILRNRRNISPESQQALAGVPTNQRAGGMAEFDPAELIRQNQIYARNRTYM